MSSAECSDSPANTNLFFKIIFSDADLKTKLMFPIKFVRKYGKNLDSRISLKAPNGLVWQVNLEIHEGKVWLKDGWPQFARFYSIQFGHLLVFKYRGHCDFKVRIFDPSCMEIDYPSLRSAKLDIGESSQVRKSTAETDHLTSSDLIRQQEKISATKKANDRALASAEAFKSDNPFFIKPMKISHVDQKRHGLVVSKAFEESYNKWKDNDQVHLQVAGKNWLVKCEMKGNMCRFSSGWDTFAQDNSLTVGDVCVFELTDACTKLLQVVIFRATKETDGEGGSATEESKSKVALASTSSGDVVRFRKKRRVTSHCLKSCHKKSNLQQERANANRELTSNVEKDKALACAQAFKSENPFFILTMKLYLIRNGRPCVPKTFKEAYENWKHNDKIILQVAGRTSPVYCTLKLNVTHYRISSGWGVFARDNSLNVGDVCVFELIMPSRKLFHVSIFRAKDEAGETRVLTRSMAVIS